MSKYLSFNIISTSLEKLKDVHNSIGIDFLAYKRHGLPVGTTISFPAGRVVRELMDEYYKPFRQSTWYYRVFESSNPRQKWLRKKYPQGGSQSTRTRGGIAKALIHDKGQPQWGWKKDYVEVLAGELSAKVPAFYLAVWLYRENEWSDDADTDVILNKFLNEFQITEDEINHIFDIEIPAGESELFQNNPITTSDYFRLVGTPPDMLDAGGAILSLLQLKNVGPSRELRFEPGNRLNLITGDNGLGKSFLLDTAWWALTGTWVENQAEPTNRKQDAIITFQIAGVYSSTETKQVKFDRKLSTWQQRDIEETISGLVIYARANNSIAVWDSARNFFTSTQIGIHKPVNPLLFDAKDVWNGLVFDHKGR